MCIPYGVIVIFFFNYCFNAKVYTYFRLFSAAADALCTTFQKNSNSGDGDGRSPGHHPNCVTDVIL